MAERCLEPAVAAWLNDGGDAAPKKLGGKNCGTFNASSGIAGRYGKLAISVGKSGNGGGNSCSDSGGGDPLNTGCRGRCDTSEPSARSSALAPSTKQLVSPENSQTAALPLLSPPLPPEMVARRDGAERTRPEAGLTVNEFAGGISTHRGKMPLANKFCECSLMNTAKSVNEKKSCKVQYFL